MSMSTDAQKQFGQYLKKRRLECQLSLREVAKRVDVHNTYLGFIERGERPLPRPELLRRLSTTLGVSEQALEWATQGKRFRSWQELLASDPKSRQLFLSLNLGDGPPSPKDVGKLIQALQKLVPGGEIVLNIPPKGMLQGGVIEDLQPSIGKGE